MTFTHDSSAPVIDPAPRKDPVHSTHATMASLSTKATSILTELAATAGLADPGVRFDRLRELGPIVGSQFGYLVTGFNESIEVLRDTKVAADPVATFATLVDIDWRTHPLLRLVGLSLFFEEKAEHAKVRQSIASHFTPGRIKALTPMIEEIVRTQITFVQLELAAGRSVDIVEHFARVVPIIASCRLLGLDEADGPQLSTWLLATQFGASGLRPSNEDLEELASLGTEFTTYLDRQLANPHPDGLLDAGGPHLRSASSPTAESFPAGKADGGLLRVVAVALNEGILTQDQARSLSFILLAAGFETTSNLIANAAHLVMSSDEFGLALRAEVSHDEWVEAVMEETLRLESPVQVSTRNSASASAFTVAGVAVEPGAPMLIMLGAAHRDPEMFPQPHRFNPARYRKNGETLTAPTLAFGSGIHHCLGVHLARLQARTALSALLPLLTQAEQVQRSPQWRPFINVRGLERLEVVTATSVAPDSESLKRIDKLRKQRARQVRNVVVRTQMSRSAHKIGRLTKRGDARTTSDADASRQQAERAAETFGELRGVMMKLGQMFSYAAPMSEGASDALSSLQDSVDPMAPGEAERIIEQELGAPMLNAAGPTPSPGPTVLSTDRQAGSGAPVASLFAQWDTKPVAAASIGQVHKATLHDGRVVAVKVQYAGIADAIAADLAQLERMNRLTARFVSKNLDAVALTAELTERFTEEIDYRIEAENQNDFCKRYAGHPYVRIPSVVPELSGRTVLTTEWIDGLRWKDFVATATQQEKDRVGEILYRFTSGGLRRYGIFQADAHPGNIIVEPNGAWVAFLDFGLVKRFTPAQAVIAQTMADAVFEGDMIDALTAAESIGYFPAGHKISAKRFSEFLEPVRALFGEAGTFTPQKHERSIRVPFDPKSEFQDVVRAANAPAATVLQDRLSYGLSALLADLRATADWPNILREYRFGNPPSTPLGEQEFAWMADRANRTAR